MEIIIWGGWRKVIGFLFGELGIYSILYNIYSIVYTLYYTLYSILYTLYPKLYYTIATFPDASEETMRTKTSSQRDIIWHHNIHIYIYTHMIGKDRDPLVRDPQTISLSSLIKGYIKSYWLLHAYSVLLRLYFRGSLSGGPHLSL